MGLDPILKKEIGKIIPHGANAGEVFVIPNRGIIQITEKLSDSKVNYTFYDEPRDIERLKLVAKKAADDAAKLAASKNAVGTANVLDSLQGLPIVLNSSQSKRFNNLDNIVQEKVQEKSMANELDVTEIDLIKQEKIEKQKKEKADVAAAINIAAELKGDIKQIKDELCVGPDCLKQRVENKFEELEVKIAKIDEKTELFQCERCGYPKVPGLSSFCPQCGAKIPSWTGDDGEPIKGWKPYYETHAQEE